MTRDAPAFAPEARSAVALLFLLAFIFASRAVVRYILSVCRFRERRDGGTWERPHTCSAVAVHNEGVAFSTFQRRYCLVTATMHGLQALSAVSLAVAASSRAPLSQNLASVHYGGLLSFGQAWPPVLELFFLALIYSVLAPLIDSLSLKASSVVCLFIHALQYALVVFCPFPSALFLAELFSNVTWTLLYYTFDSWMVQEHRHCRFQGSWLPTTYVALSISSCFMTFAGAQLSKQLHRWGGHSTVLLTAFCLTLGNLFVCLVTWTEAFPYKAKAAWRQLLPRYRFLSPYTIVWASTHTFLAAVSTVCRHFQIVAVSVAQNLVILAVSLVVQAWYGSGSWGRADPAVSLLNLTLAFCVGATVASMVSASQDYLSSTKHEQSNPYFRIPSDHRGLLTSAESEWHPAVEVVVEPYETELSSKELDVIDQTHAPSHYAVWDRYKVPLRVSLGFYELLIFGLFGWVALVSGKPAGEPGSASNAMYFALWIHFCFGGHVTIASTLQAQLLPLEGRVTVLGLCAVIAQLMVVCLIKCMSYFILRRPLTLHHITPDTWLVAAVFCGVALIITIIAGLLCQYRQPLSMQFSSCIAATAPVASPPWRAFTPLQLFFKNKQLFDTPPVLTPVESPRPVFCNDVDGNSFPSKCSLITTDRTFARR